MKVVEIPLRLRSRLNAREHWGQRARRTRREREAAYMLTPRVAVPCVVRIVRIGKRRMDGDNLQDSAKAVRDGVAQKLGVDDGDPRVTWEYGQEIGKEYGVRIEIEAAGARTGT